MTKCKYIHLRDPKYSVFIIELPISNISNE